MIWEGGATPIVQGDRRKTTAKRSRQTSLKKRQENVRTGGRLTDWMSKPIPGKVDGVKTTEVSKIKRKMGLEPRMKLEDRNPEQPGSKVKEIRMMFELPEKENPKKIVKKKLKNDDSWRIVRLGCDNLQTGPKSRKRKPEPGCSNDDDEGGLEKDDAKQPLDHKNQTWDGWRGESGTVGFQMGGQVVRKKGTWGNLEWKGGKDEMINYNGHSPQPMPNRGLQKGYKKEETDDD